MYVQKEQILIWRQNDRQIVLMQNFLQCRFQIPVRTAVVNSAVFNKNPISISTIVLAAPPVMQISGTRIMVRQRQRQSKPDNFTNSIAEPIDAHFFHDVLDSGPMSILPIAPFL